MQHQDRLMAESERLNAMHERQMSERESPVYMFLKSLSLIKKKNEDLIRKTFSLSIQTKLLQYLQYTKKKGELSRICKFILDTLPQFKTSTDKDEEIAVISYYKKVLDSMGDIA